MYTNIPTVNLRHITEDILDYNLTETKQKQEILKIYDLIINQNYFSHNGTVFHQKEGQAMGAPSSALF
jgi:hypothetical protein